MPAEPIVYLGDTARVPYGIRSLETVRQYALQDASFLLRWSPKLIVVACNTASAAAVDALEAFCRPVEVVDVIRPSAAAAVARTDGAIGVIGTEATVASGAYERAVHALDGQRTVFAKACPLLVPIVEEGRGEDDPIVLHVLGDYLRELQRVRPGALILGCTHYPLLARAIGKLMGPHVPLIDSAQSVAMEVQARLRAAGLIRPGGTGALRCFTTDNPQRFTQLSERFGGRRVEHVELVGTDELRSAVAPADREAP
jgi:glutamate racemase